MRIISGKHRGRKLISPKDQLVRPTQDRIKEALFNIIQNNINNSKFLDLFAGSGAMGIEAISRGAIAAFCDQNIQSVKLLKSNLKLINESADVYNYDAIECIRRLNEKNEKFDFLYIDPPYMSNLETEVLQTLIKYPIMNKNAKIIIEHKADKEIDVSYQHYSVSDIRKYGITKLTFLEISENK